MKIERVDDKTVKCFLSNEELEAYDIDYKDFVMRSEKAKEVVQDIIEHAEEEVGYKPPKFAFDLQIMMLPDQGLLLTFSEKDPFDAKDGAQILECLKEMKQVLLKTKEQIGEQPPVVQNNAKPEQVGEGRRPERAIFGFDSLSSVLDYVAVLPKNLRVHSELYVMNGIYYLYMTKNAASYERYSRACIQAMEFGSLYSAEEEKLLHLREHGECLISERALKKLRL
ncbi:MAG: adaptor protein MecA [Acetatifactor sp.]